MEENNKTINLLYTLDTPKPPEEVVELTGVKKLIKEDIVKLLTEIPAGRIREIFKDLNLNMLDHALVISIYGSWGSGKTTLIKRIEKELKDKVDFFTFSLWDHSGGDIRKSFLIWLGREIENKLREQEKTQNLENLLHNHSPEELDHLYSEAKNILGKDELKKLSEEHRAAALHRLRYLTGLVAGTHRKVQTRGYRRPNYLALATIGIALLIGSSFISAVYTLFQAAGNNEIATAIVKGLSYGLLVSLLASILLVPIIRLILNLLISHGKARWVGQIWVELAYLLGLLLTLMPTIYPNIHFLKDILPSFPPTTIPGLTYLTSALAVLGIGYLATKLIVSKDTNPLEIIFSYSEKEEVEELSTISEVATDFRKVFLEMLFAVRPILLQTHIKPAVIVIDDLDRLQPEDAHKMLNEMRVFTSLSDVPQGIIPQNIKPETIKTHLFFIIPISVGTFEAAHLDEKFFNKLFFLSYTLPTPSLPEKFEQLKNLVSDIADIVNIRQSSPDSIAFMLLSTAKIVYLFAKRKKLENAEYNKRSNFEEYYDEITMRDLKKIANHVAFSIKSILKRREDSTFTFEELLAIFFFASLQVLGKIETPSDVIALTEYLRSQAQRGRLEWLSPSLLDKLHFYMLNLYHTNLTYPKEQKSPIVEEIKLILINPPSLEAKQENGSSEKTTDPLDAITQHIEKLLGKKVLPTDTDILDAISRAVTSAMEYWENVDRLPGSPTFLHMLHLIEQIKSKFPTDEKEGLHPAHIIAERVKQFIKTMPTDQLETILQKAFSEINISSRFAEIDTLTELLKKYVADGYIPPDVLSKAAFESVSSNHQQKGKNVELIPLIIVKEVMIAQHLNPSGSWFASEEHPHLFILKSAYLGASSSRQERIFTIPKSTSEPYTITKLTISPVTHISTHSGKKITEEIGHIFWEASEQRRLAKLPHNRYNLSKIQQSNLTLLTLADQISELASIFQETNPNAHPKVL